MKAIVLYHPRSNQALQVEEYTRDFERTQNRVLNLVSLDSREGSDMARLYDVMHNPCILVIRDDGQLVKDWQGNTLPLMGEVASYLAA